ncbi:MAG: hypothetical protein QXK47_05890, partial [Candidatus Bathyarchaeia archaeon]
MVYFFVLASTNMLGLVEIVNHNIVSGQAVSLKLETVMCSNILSVRRCLYSGMAFEKAVSKGNFKDLENLNFDKL